MKFITEYEINQTILFLEQNEDRFEEYLNEFSEAQPFLLSFLLSDGFQVLDENEKNLLFYLALVIYHSADENVEDLPIIELEDIEELDEKNWTIVDQQKLKSFTDIADCFFENYTQEDLLAFVEDALAEDEEEDFPISGIGRNVIFVSMKTVIDALDKAV